MTKRFADAVIDLCPDAVDQLLAHPNVEQAFAYTPKGGEIRRRRGLLERIYETRSLPTHAGPGLSAMGFAALASPDTMRIALLSDLVRSAVLSYMQAPRSSLIGHPAIYPPTVDCPKDDCPKKA